MSNTFVPAWTLIVAAMITAVLIIIFIAIIMEQKDRILDLEDDMKRCERTMLRVCQQRDIAIKSNSKTDIRK